MANVETKTPKATRKEWIGLAVISVACLLYVMDLSVLYLAVPSLTRDLEPSSSQLLWITDIYGFLVAGFLITMGTLGDRIGCGCVFNQRRDAHRSACCARYSGRHGRSINLVVDPQHVP